MMKLVELAVGKDPALSFSPYVWRTKMALAHKGFHPESVFVTFTDKAALEPAGAKTVPALEDGGKWIADSWDIACYLEATYPDRPALFVGPREKALSRFFNAWVDRTVVLGLFPVLILDIHALLDEENQAYFRSTREARLGSAMEEYAADRDGHVANLQKALSPMRYILSDQSYLAGDQPGYADFAAFGPFQWARSVSRRDVLEPGDAVTEWRERMLDLFDGFARQAPRVA